MNAACSVCGHIHARRGEDGMVNLDTRQCYDCGTCSEKARRQHEAEKKAEALVDSLTRFVNGMSREEADAFSTALANDHPTLIGQVAKAVGIGVMRRVTRDHWMPYQQTMDTNRPCPNGRDLPVHPDHDGRLDCETVIGAELMARQSFI